MKPLPSQSVAARSLLEWSQAELAAASGVGLSTVEDFESAARQPTENELAAIRAAIEGAGVSLFNDGGVGKYEEPPNLTLQQIQEALCSRDTRRAAFALISASYYLEDWHVAQGLCLEALSSTEDTIRQCAIIGFCHIVRIHGNLDVGTVFKEIEEKIEPGSYLWGYVDHLKDEIPIWIARVPDL